jgi:hypothetical protein
VQSKTAFVFSHEGLTYVKNMDKKTVSRTANKIVPVVVSLFGVENVPFFTNFMGNYDIFFMKLKSGKKPPKH